MRESGKQSVKEAKLHIIKDYFNEVNEEDLILDDDDDEWGSAATLSEKEICWWRFQY